MDLFSLNLKCDDEVFERRFKEESMNTYKVVRALNHIVDVIYDTIDALIADYDVKEEVEDE